MLTVGVAHIEAAIFASLGIGDGYPQAEDHACTIGGQVLDARGERGRFLRRAADDVNARSYVSTRALRVRDRFRAAEFAAHVQREYVMTNGAP